MERTKTPLCTQVRALLRRNWIIKKQLWKSSLVELLLPSMIMLILVGIRAAISESYQEENKYKDELQVLDTMTNMGVMAQTVALQGHILALAPSSSSIAQEVMKQLLLLYPVLQLGKNVQMFASDDDMNDHMMEPTYPDTEYRKVQAGVVFDATVDNQYSYYIRMNQTTRNNDYQIPNTILPRTTDLTVSYNSEWRKYYSSGFMGLQNFVDACIQFQVNNISLKEQFDTNLLLFQPFPVPAHTKDSFAGTLGASIGILFTMVYWWPVSRLVKNLVEEKEMRWKEHMKMMGLRDLPLFLSWAITYLIIFCTSATITTLITGTVFKYSNSFIIWIYFATFGVGVFSYCYLMHTIFNKASSAGMFASVLWVLMFFTSYTLDDNSTYQTNIMASLMVNVCFGLGGRVISVLESSQRGIQHSSMNEKVNNMSVGGAIGMFIFDSILYLSIAWYLQQTWRNEFGVPKRHCFFCYPSFWRARKAGGSGIEPGDEELNPEETHELFEKMEDEASRTKLVQIQHLSKVYPGMPTPVTAVDKFTLSLYQNEIYALLGHNGAGKSTVINLLTGLISGTGGDAMVMGRSVNRELDQVRLSMGVCAQQDILYPLLSVRQHLVLYCTFKSIPRDKLEDTITNILDKVGLSSKINVKAGELSGGMKRKLCLGLALVGDPTVVFLDEPTSGMDPFSRRKIWDMLKEAKKDKIIILSTHFMDEADVLGDRIGIMSDGALRCSGTSLFLKNAYGVGYSLTVLKKEGADSEPIIECVLNQITEAEILSDVAAEVSFRLPFSQSGSFAGVFDFIDANKVSLGVESYGVSVTTLEEVFLRVKRSGYVEEKRKVRAPALPAPSNKDNNSNSNTATVNQVHVRERGTGAKSSGGSGVDEAAATRAVGEEMGGQVGAAAVVGDNKLDNQGEEEQESTLLLSNVVPGPAPDLAQVRTIKSNRESRRASRVEELRDNREGLDDVSFTLNQHMFFPHMKALLIKRFHHSKRDRKAMVWQVVVPAIILLLGTIMVKYGTDTAVRTVALDVSQFNDPLRVPVNVDAFNKGSLASIVVEPSLVRQSCPVGNLKYGNGLVAQPLTIMPAMQRDYLIEIDQMQNYLLSTWNTTYETKYLGLLAEALLMNQGAKLLVNVSKPVLSPAILAMVPPSLLPQVMAAANMFSTSTFNVTAKATGVAGAQSLFALATLFFNTTGRHAAPTMLNLYNNDKMRRLAAAKNGGSLLVKPSIAVYTKPMPLTASQSSLRSSSLSIIIVIAFAFIPASYARFIVMESETKAKHQQVIAGLSLSAYWVSNYLYDFLQFLVPSFACFIILAIFNVDTLLGVNFPPLFLLTMFYGLSVIPFSYLFSFAFTNPSSAQNSILGVYLISGVVFLVTVIVLSIIESTREVADVLAHVLRLFPNFAFAFAVASLMVREVSSLGDVRGEWAMDISGWALVYMACEAVVYFALVMVVEYVNGHRDSFSFLPCLPNNNVSAADLHASESVTVSLEEEDADVKKEKARVDGVVAASPVGNSSSNNANDSSSHAADAILLQHVRKAYPANNGQWKFAVRDVSLGIPAGQCFGLLGTNGAGKTTVLKMLSFDLQKTTGVIRLEGQDIGSHREECRLKLGYCPQFDSLLPLMTATETLSFYARIKGIEVAKLDSYVRALVQHLGLKQYADRPCGTYSGGNKRKLSLGIALTGNPAILLLDEPSTGMDPAARRTMWKLIGAEAALKHRTVVLTTHSMEECENLCTRIGIMVDGQLKCLGSSQRLKEIYGSGYQLDVMMKGEKPADESASAAAAPTTGDGAMVVTVDPSASLLGSPTPSAAPTNRVLEENIVKMTKFVGERWRGSVCIERDHNRLVFRVPGVLEGEGREITLGSIFREIETNKVAQGISRYAISETSLEQIFIGFAKKMAKTVDA